MNLMFRRSRQKSTPRHTLAAVRASRTAAELTEPASLPAVQEPKTAITTDLGDGFGEVSGTAPARCNHDYDTTGWGDAPAALPSGDETLLFRIPAPAGGPGLVLPPGAPWQADAEDALPPRSPGASFTSADMVPALRTEPADPDRLRDLRDALKALPDEPRHDDEDEDENTAPAAYLRAIVPGGDTGVTQIQDALGRSPRFAGSGLLADGRPVAGMYLGTNDDGWFVVDALTPEWCGDAIAALTEMRDSLEAAREQAEDGEAA